MDHMDQFADYLWYLLTSPFKRIRKAVNAWWIWCRVIGAMFDEAKEDILRARDEGMVAACSQEMLAVHGADRGLSRYTGEDPENFRRRIAMHEEVCILGGLNEGVLLAVRSLGYSDAEIQRAVDLTGDPDRWAEFFLVIRMEASSEHPIPFDILKKTVRKWKESDALDNYLMAYYAVIREHQQTVVSRIDYRTVLHYFNYRKLDGSRRLDGSHLLDASRVTYKVTVEEN